MLHFPLLYKSKQVVDENLKVVSSIWWVCNSYLKAPLLTVVILDSNDLPSSQAKSSIITGFY